MQLNIRIMMLFNQQGHDMDKLLAAYPEITPDDVAQVTMEVMGAMGLMAGMKEWIGGTFDPAEFDADDVTEALAGIRI